MMCELLIAKITRLTNARTNGPKYKQSKATQHVLTTAFAHHTTSLQLVSSVAELGSTHDPSALGGG